MHTFTNPVIEGFSPDPSVCAVGEDYYLVTSTFAYFPGVPIYHSKDLANWQQIGNVLDRESQLNLSDAGISRGIFAPTIRHHDGTFYMITTNVSHGGNFIVTATDPAGPWSDPYFLEGAEGIDPSLFFDEDGRCYYTGTRPNTSGPKYDGDWEVWLQEVDLTVMQLTGVSTNIWRGALRDVIWPEAPHLYKKDGYYYLMIAEAGTGPNHCVTIARSKKIDGHYVGHKNNPILTHRHLGKDFPVQNVGHGDLVETTDGKWYMLCLASRKFEGYSNLGRETFLAEVIWEDGWPVVNPGLGRLLEEQEHALPLYPWEKESPTRRFDEMRSEYLFMRNPKTENYDFESRPEWLRLHPTIATIHGSESPTYLGLRQTSLWYELSTKLECHLNDGGEAGLVLFQNEQYAVRLVVRVNDGHSLLQCIATIDGKETVLGEEAVTNNQLELALIGTGQKLRTVVRIDGTEKVLAEHIDSHYLSTDVAGGFVGCTFGIYATSSNPNPGYVDFEWLNLEKMQEGSERLSLSANL